MTTSDLITQAEVITPTITQFCHQIWQLKAKVLHIESDENKTYLITDVTPFHPVPLPNVQKHIAAASVYYLAPLHLPRRPTRPLMLLPKSRWAL